MCKVLILKGLFSKVFIVLELAGCGSGESLVRSSLRSPVSRWVGTPSGLTLLSAMIAIDSEIGLAKYLQPCGLRVNSAKETT
jgi:hypothetical protein